MTGGPGGQKQASHCLDAGLGGTASVLCRSVNRCEHLSCSQFNTDVATVKPTAKLVILVRNSPVV